MVARMPVGRVAVYNCCKLYGGLGGHHWFAAFRATSERLQLFDSAGLRPRRLLNLKMPSGVQWIAYNHRRLQARGSETCGLYALYYCKLRSDEQQRRRRRHLQRRRRQPKNEKQQRKKRYAAAAAATATARRRRRRQRG